MMLRRGLWTLALACAALVATAAADPREVEPSVFHDEFGEATAERGAAAPAVEQHLEFALEHNLPVVSTKAPKAAGSEEDDEEEEEEPQFTPRGRVEIVLSSRAAKPSVAFLDVPVFSPTEEAQLAAMLKDNRLYTIRARSDPQNPNSPYVVTSIPMCVLAGTRMREELTFHLTNDGKLMAMEYLTPYGGPAVCKEFQRRTLSNVKLTSSGSALQPQNGPAPPKVVAVKKKEAPAVVKNPMKQEGEDDQQSTENQSFLRRYWYVILPLMLFMLFGGGGEPQGAPAAGGGGAARR